ncbi:CpaF family protein, partial [Escherichia coli]|nr:CpaF family protein [Escherichia coli]
MKASTRPTVSEAKDFIRDQIFLRIEPLVAVRISQQDLMVSVNKVVAEIATGRKILLNQDEQRVISASIVDEMVGLGPIEPLLRDLSVADILVNGPRMIYV